MKRILIASLLALLLVPAAAGSATSERATKKVSAYNNVFKPKSITVSKGTRVTWVVKEGAHNVKGRGFSSPVMTKGRSYSKKFKRGGTFRYVCTLHSGMKGKVVVR